MIALFFKAKRRLELVIHSVYCRFRILQWKHLHGGRFFVGRNFKFGQSFSLAFEISPNSKATLTIGNDILIRDNSVLRIGETGKLVIGDGCFFNNGCSITSFGETVIGKNCQFGENVKLYDHNHFYNDKLRTINEQGYNIGTITIGNNCWIGSNVVILKDVVIGDNVVVGAGCVVHKSIPSNTVVMNKQELIYKPY